MHEVFSFQHMHAETLRTIPARHKIKSQGSEKRAQRRHTYCDVKGFLCRYDTIKGTPPAAVTAAGYRSPEGTFM